jgi:hypothetical protein
VFLALRKGCHLKDPPSLMCLICVFGFKKRLSPERPAFADVFDNVFLALRKSCHLKDPPPLMHGSMIVNSI